MQPFIPIGFVLLFAVGLFGCSPSARKASSSGSTNDPPLHAPAEKSEQPLKNVVYEDSFSDLTNMQSVYVNGVYDVMDAGSTRIVLAFMEVPESETFSLKILEDAVTKGADDKPGVLALSWDKLPSKAGFSGFTYHGRKSSGGKLALPFVNAAKVADDLQGYRLRFRFKGVNLMDALPVSIQVKCRFEPLVANTQSYDKRLELPMLVTNEQWQLYDEELQYGQNMEAFLASVHDEHPSYFKVIWSQSGPITKYRAGNTLLIDDIEIVGPSNDAK